jgi:hypothetical protein
MLSTAKIRNGSWRYYANQVQHGRCEYFLGIGEAPGRWSGRGLDALGLEPGAMVSERELEALFGRALHPTTGEQLGRAWRGRRRHRLRPDVLRTEVGQRPVGVG